MIPESKNDPFRVCRPKPKGDVLYNCCTKFYPDGSGGWYPVQRVTFDRPIYNPGKLEIKKYRPDIAEAIQESVDPLGASGNFWRKSFNRARQTCFDYLMCNPDLDTFLTFTVDPDEHDARDYCALVKYLGRWLDNRVRRHDLKYILVPELHKSGAYHFHGVANFSGLKLVNSGYVKHGKYTVGVETLTQKALQNCTTIFNVADLPLGWSTAIPINGEDAQVKVTKYIWKYMTKQDGAKIAGRFYLHGGDLQAPKLVYTREYFEPARGVLVTYGGTACKIEQFPI